MKSDNNNQNKPNYSNSKKCTLSKNGSGGKQKANKPLPVIKRCRVRPYKTEISKFASRPGSPLNTNDFGPVTKNNGFIRGRKPERIICGFIRNQKLHFLFKFRFCSKNEIITANDLRYYAPKMLIKYYQAHIKYEKTTTD